MIQGLNRTFNEKSTMTAVLFLTKAQFSYRMGMRDSQLHVFQESFPSGRKYPRCIICSQFAQSRLDKSLLQYNGSHA